MGDKAITLEDIDAIVGITPSAAPQSASIDNPINEDMPQLASLRSKFEKASKYSGIPVEVLAGVASRESRAGRFLNKEGYDKEKKAYGVMQIDERFHKLKGKSPDSQEHINQAAYILAANKKIVDKKYPAWTEEQRMQGAVAAYNMGIGNVRTWKNLDKGTTGGDYSADVMLRAKAYKSLTNASNKKDTKGIQNVNYRP